MCVGSGHSLLWTYASHMFLHAPPSVPARTAMTELLPIPCQWACRQRLELTCVNLQGHGELPGSGKRSSPFKLSF